MLELEAIPCAGLCLGRLFRSNPRADRGDSCTSNLFRFFEVSIPAAAQFCRLVWVSPTNEADSAQGNRQSKITGQKSFKAAHNYKRRRIPRHARFAPQIIIVNATSALSKSLLYSTQCHVYIYVHICTYLQGKPFLCRIKTLAASIQQAYSNRTMLSALSTEAVPCTALQAGRRAGPLYCRAIVLIHTIPC